VTAVLEFAAVLALALVPVQAQVTDLELVLVQLTVSHKHLS